MTKLQQLRHSAGLPLRALCPNVLSMSTSIAQRLVVFLSLLMMGTGLTWADEQPLATFPSNIPTGYSTTGTTTTVSGSNYTLNTQTVYAVAKSSEITISVPNTITVTKVQVIGTTSESGSNTDITVKNDKNESVTGGFNKRDASVSTIELLPKEKTTTITISSGGTRAIWIQYIKIYGTTDSDPAPTYKLTFDVNPTGAGTISAVIDGTSTVVNSGDKFEEGTKITLTPSANPGYTRILGASAAWSGSSTATNEITWTMAAKDKTLTANFRGNVITYDTDGGNEIASATYAGSAIVLPTPTKDGYTFDGWYNGENKINETSYTPLTDVTLTAHWTEDVKIDVTRFNMMGNQEYEKKVGTTFNLVSYIGGPTWTKDLAVSQIRVTSLNTDAVTVDRFSIDNNQKDDSNGNKLSKISINLNAVAAGDAKLKIEFLGNDGYNPAEYTTTNTETIHVYETRTVTFYKNDGGATTATQADIKDNTATALNTITTIGWTRTNYTFAGWAETAEGAVVYADGADITITADKDLYAVWKSSACDILTATVAGNNATIDGTDITITLPYDVTEYSAGKVKVDITLSTGASADTNTTFTKSTPAADGTSVVAQDIVVTAQDGTTQKTYHLAIKRSAAPAPGSATTITFSNSAPVYTPNDAAGTVVVNGGYNTSKNGVKVEGSSTLVTLTLTVASTVTFNFAGTNSTIVIDGDSKNCSTASPLFELAAGTHTLKKGSGTNDLISITIVPKSDATTHTVTFHKNDDGDDTATQTDVADNTATALKTISTIGWTRTNYTFMGWAETAEGEVAYADAANITITADKDLYAVWKSSACALSNLKYHTTNLELIDGVYTVTIPFSDQGDSQEGGKYYYDVNFNISANATVTCSSATPTVSDGVWTIRKSLGTAEGAKVNYTLTVTAEDGTTKADYKVKLVRGEDPNYSITFNKNADDATGEMTTLSVEKDQAVTLTANAFSRAHYTFNGWNTKSDGSGDKYADNAEIIPTKNITLYAQWAKEVYTCSVAVNDGSMGTATVNGNSTPASVAYKENANYVATPKSGYRFVNWTDEGGNEISTSATYQVAVDANIALTANFEEEPKNVTSVAHTWDLTSLDISSEKNDGVDSGTNFALYWNTQAGVVKDAAEGDKLGLTGLKINSVSDTYIVIPGNASGVLKVTFAPRKKDQETGIAVNGKDAVLYDGSSVEEFSFNVANKTAEPMKVSITRATSTAREGVITKIIWTPLQTSNLMKKNAVEMLAGHDYINTAQLTKDTHYTTSSTGALTYTSNNTDIVTVDANGVLTAKKAGIATIRVSQAATFDYEAGSCDVTVNVSDLYASSNAVEVQKDGSINLDIETTSTGTISVSSDKESIATASYNSSTKKLTINGVADGTATITVTEAAVSGQYVKSSITIAVSVYTSKVYYQVTSDEATHKLLLNDAIKSEGYLSVSTTDTKHWQEKTAKLDDVDTKKKYYQLKSTDRVMKVNVQGAKAFEIFTIGGSNRTYYLNVDGVNVGMINAPSGTTSSGLFECAVAGSTITLTGNNGDVFPAQIKFYTTLPSIIKVNNSSAFSEITEFVDAGDQTYTVTSNNSSAINVADVVASIATVSLSGSTLTVHPVKAGSFTMKLSQSAGNVGGRDYAAAEMDIKVTIKKHALKLSYDKSKISIDKNINPSATLTESATLSCTIDGVTTPISDLSTKGVTLTYDSDDQNVATVTSAGVVSLVGQPQGTATITASIESNNNYSVTSANHKISVIDGFNFKMNATGTKSDINKLYPIYGDGEENADNILAGIYYGGWKYKQSYSSDELADSKWRSESKPEDANGYKVITDSWPDSKEYSRAGNAEKIYIDGYQQQTQANNNARSENVERFEIGKPFSLPVRGAYIKFDAERTGIMTAYFVQNGDLSYSGETLTEGFARRPYFITDELGNIVTPISAMSKEKLPAQDEVTTKSVKSTTDTENYNKALTDKYLAEDGTGLKSSWVWSTTNRQPVLYDEVTKGYHVLQKAYVKYVFNVEAGKSYYVFSSSSKIGFAGANFQVSSEDNLTSRNIAHEAVLNLDQTADYTAPTKKTWYDKVTLNRSFKAGEWSTITLPFSLSESKVKEIFGEGTQLTVFNGVDGSTVNFFYHVDQNIIAGYPYIILPKNNVERIEVKNVTIDPDVDQYKFNNTTEGGHPHWVAGGEYEFKGLDGYSKSGDKERMSKYSYYVSAAGDGIQNGLHRTTTGTLTCNGYRAYLKYVGASPIAPAKFAAVNISGIEDKLDDNVTTEIMMALEAEDLLAPTTSRGVYNLNGQKVAENTKDLPAGIYVVNGKKIIINK